MPSRWPKLAAPTGASGRATTPPLNFGDIFSYALARVSSEPLLFKGDDFARTDIGRVI